MITAGPSLLLAALAVQSPAADSLRALATRVSETALVTEARTRPLVAREAITGALDRNELTTAQSLAAAYALAWSDSFLVRQVAHFVAWPPDMRAVKVWVDSVRRVGITTYGANGPGAAIVVWRRALARATSIGDSAGIGSLAGNIGAGFLADGQPDSAEAYLTRARTIARAVGDYRVEANTIVALAGLSEDRGDLAAARDGYTSALAIQQRIGDTRGMAAAYNNLGLLAEGVGDQSEARRQFEAALMLNRTDGRDEIAATNLVNLAGLASLSGDFGRAERLYRDALATWRSREAWADAASALHGLGQLELRRGDYPAAQATLTDALAIYDRTGPTPEAISVRRDLAGALAARGDLQGALDLLRRTQRLADSTRAPGAVRAKVALSRADYALQLNALGDAEQLYGRAEFLSRQSGDLEGVAEAEQGRGLLFLARENYSRAAVLLQTALRTQSTAGHVRGAALTRVSLGAVLREQGDIGGARRELVRATIDLDRVGDPVGAAEALAERGALAAGSGATAVAESLYRAGLDRLGDRIAPEVAWRLHEGLALALRSHGALDDAAREFRAALAETDRPAGSLALAERRSAYLADKWEVYANVALTERARGYPGAAFEASERLRAREMLELLARGRIADPIDTTAELIEREQDLRRHIAELMQRVEAPESTAAGVRGPAAPNGAALGALARAQDAYAELLLEMREHAPRHVDLVARQTAGWRDVAQHLGVADAFIEYLVSDSGALAFTVTRDTLAIVDLGIDRRSLARLVALARGALEPHPGGEDLWRGPMRRLHDYLIAPLEETGLLAGKTRLVLVPHAELHYLPFAALVDS
ncbi:MAG TPA: tetratricopeptide repeat protein, partial [Gemmatimonadales bacterium]|nr:tetratricopeptide repeat protein [Gemmatimonadales bacterium]